MDDYVMYMGYEWLNIEDGLVTIGINEEGVEEFTEINSIDLPEEHSDVDPDEVCGELETDQGPLNLYSPVRGRVVEINEAVVDNPSLIIDDPMDDGWLFKVEAADLEDLEKLTTATTAADEE